ncbi:hypothetical protein RND81_11G042100 [Saponaria officinalis]
MTSIHSHNLHLHLPHPPSTLTATPTTTLPPSTTTGLQFRHKLLYLESLNINSLKALSLNPTLRTTPLSTLLAVEDTLLSTFHLPRSSLGRILDMFPSLLSAVPSATLLPVHHFLRHHADLSSSLLPRAVLRCPRLLVSSVPDQLRPSLLFLRHRLRLPITPHTAVLLVSSVDNTLLPKLHFLENLGFAPHQVVVMVQRSPALLTYSIENNLVPKTEFFLREMKGDLGEIERFPQYFSFSLDGRIKPRFRLLEEYGVSMSLKDMLTVSDGEFDIRLLELRLRTADQ